MSANSPLPLPSVLIAEDDPDDCLMIRDAFADRFPDCRLYFVHDGDQLFRFLNREHPYDTPDQPCSLPDLILLDLNMPLKGGRESLQELKSTTGLRRIPIIVLTTSHDEQDILECYDLGANSYIVKPSRYSDLLDVVSSIKNYWADTVCLPRPECHEQH